MDSYKVEQLRAMLAAEKQSGFGAQVVARTAGAGKTINLDAGALEVLIEYFEFLPENRRKGVEDLTRDQIEELKSAYFYGDEGNPDVLDGLSFYWEVPDSVIFEHFAGTDFVDDDFSCSCGNLD